MESISITHPQWRKDSIFKYQKWRRKQLSLDTEFNEQIFKFEDVERDEMKENYVPYMYEFVIASANFTLFEEWAKHLFSISDNSELPLLIIYDPKQDGYYTHHSIDIQFINDVIIEHKLEITYTKGYISRQALKLEKWLNTLHGWQIALLFIGIFGGLCAIVVGLDYLCTPKFADYKEE